MCGGGGEVCATSVLVLRFTTIIKSKDPVSHYIRPVLWSSVSVLKTNIVICHVCCR